MAEQPQWGQQPQPGQQPQWGQQSQWGQQPQWGGPPPAPAGPGSPPGPPPGAPGMPAQYGWRSPGIVPLRPLGLGEILDGAFRAIRSNPRTMIGVSATVVAITVLLTAIPTAAAMVDLMAGLPAESTEEESLSEILDELSAVLPIAVGGGLIQWLALTVLSGMLMVPVAGAVIGRRTPPAAMWARTKRKILPLIGLALVLAVGGLLFMAMCLAPGAALLVVEPVLGVIALILGAVFSIVVLIALSLAYFALAPPAMVLDDRGVFGSLRRSWQLVRGSFWRVFGIMLLTLLIATTGMAILGFPFGLISSAITATAGPEPGFGLTLTSLLVNNVGSVVGGAILYPFQAAVTALLYIDLRMRREGLDLELIRSTAGGAG